MTELGGAEGPSVEIRKYANRRLYDTDRSCYVTLEDVARMIDKGARVRVLTARHGIDVTRQVLAQIMFENEVNDGVFEENLLRNLIRLRRHPNRDRLSRHISDALAAFPKPPRRTEGKRLEDGRTRARARLDALQMRIEKLIRDIDRKPR